MNPVLTASLIGLLATTQLHIAKGLQRYGIHVLPDGLKKETWRSRQIWLYILGFVLNNSLFVYAMWAATYAPPSYYTSMFGAGLMVLLIFSDLVLKEKHSTREHLGALMIVAGTLTLGWDGISRDPADMAQIRIGRVVIFGAVYFSLLLLLLYYSRRRRKMPLMSAAFGLLSGSFATMDPFLKGIGQNMGGGGGLVPSVAEGWIFWILSFLFAFLGFWTTQVSFHLKVRTSLQVAAYNIAFVTLPLLLQGLTLPDFDLTPWTLAGLAVLIIGLIVMIRGQDRTESTS